MPDNYILLTPILTCTTSFITVALLRIVSILILGGSISPAVAIFSKNIAKSLSFQDRKIEETSAVLQTPYNNMLRSTDEVTILSEQPSLGKMVIVLCLLNQIMMKTKIRRKDKKRNQENLVTTVQSTKSFELVNIYPLW